MFRKLNDSRISSAMAKHRSSVAAEQLPAPANSEPAHIIANVAPCTCNGRTNGISSGGAIPLKWAGHSFQVTVIAKTTIIYVLARDIRSGLGQRRSTFNK